MTARILCSDCTGDLARAILIERLVGYDANAIASVAYQLMWYGHGPTRAGRSLAPSAGCFGNGTPVGVIGCARREVRPFTAAQIGLVKTFADQAVIAIENVRLFDEVQARTGELARSVEELRALGEVSQAVNSA